MCSDFRLYLPFALILRLSDSEGSQKFDKCTIIMHDELFLSDWHDSHRQILWITEVWHFEIASEKYGIFFRLFVFSVIFLNLP